MGTQKISIGMLLSVLTFNTHAALTNYTGADNVGLVYSSVSNITWAQDANLFKTLYDADNSLITQIVNVTPSYNDPTFGLQLIDGFDFDTVSLSGRMTWWGAKAFINYLNNINYGGSNQWRLPSVGGNPQLSFAYNLTGSEFAQLFYGELGGSQTNSIPDTVYFINESPYINPLSNLPISVYWTDTEYASEGASYLFRTFNGSHGAAFKYYSFFTWPVSPGQVPTVPLPSAVWLFGTGVAGLLGLKRCRLGWVIRRLG